MGGEAGVAVGGARDVAVGALGPTGKPGVSTYLHIDHQHGWCDMDRHAFSPASVYVYPILKPFPQKARALHFFIRGSFLAMHSSIGVGPEVTT